jgi:hypothetical protein
MQVFIQDRETGLFFSTRQTWTRDLRKARSFQSALQAWDFCQERNFENTEIIFKAPNEAPRAILAYARFDRELQHAF